MSYIEEFQREIEDRGLEKKSGRVITIDGLSGAGKGTLARQIGDITGLKVYSAGDFFRAIAEEKGMDVNELSEQADREVDLEIDRRTLEKGLREDCVIESRIASRVLGDYSDLRIRLKASLEERARRVKGRERDESLEEVKERIQKRDRDNWRRYRDYYGIEDSLDIYHLMVDNTDMDPGRQKRFFKHALQTWFNR